MDTNVVWKNGHMYFLGEMVKVAGVTTKSITNPADWRVDDHAEMTDGDLHGATVTGPLYVGLWESSLYVGGLCARSTDGLVPPGRTVVVTREIPDIPEPQTIGAVALFGDGCTAVRRWGSAWPWLVERDDFTWSRLVSAHGPAVAVSEHPEGWDKR